LGFQKTFSSKEKGFCMAKKTAKKAEKEKDLDIFQSNLVSRHELLNAEERSELMKKLNIKLKQLPRMKRDDAGVDKLEAKRGDVVRIVRKSLSAGEYYYYRVVV
jgi:DNA-directed RNA polymerase subunit H